MMGVGRKMSIYDKEEGKEELIYTFSKLLAEMSGSMVFVYKGYEPLENKWKERARELLSSETDSYKIEIVPKKK